MTINLDEITKALEEATQGKWIDPWETEIDEDFEGIKSETGEVVLSVQWHDGDRLYLCKPNAHLITNAPEWLRLLVERVRRLEKVAEAACGVAAELVCYRNFQAQGASGLAGDCLADAIGLNLDTLARSLTSANVPGWEE